MMNKAEWMECILSGVTEMASEEYQRRVWLGADVMKVSSWEEAMCRLFDDYDVNGFLERAAEFGLTDFQIAKLKMLRASLIEFGDLMGEAPAPERVLAHPEWARTRQIAREVLVAFGAQPT